MTSMLRLILRSLIIPTLAFSSQVSHIQEPALDLHSFDDSRIGYLGDFDAISFYSYTGQSNFTNQNTLVNNLYYVSGGSNDQYVSIGEVSGSVDQILPIEADTFLLIGDFTSIAGENLTSPALFNVSNNEFKSLDPSHEIDGAINAAYYDSGAQILYFGGNFTVNDTKSAAIYSIPKKSLSSTLFEGFGDGSSVNSIVKIGSNIIFGGQFSTLGLPQLLSSTYNVSSILFETDQLVSLKHATFSSSDGSSTPESIACPGGNEWEVSSESATLDVTLPYTVIPSKIRVYNSDSQNSQVSLFRLITAPANGIMNLTYVDPSTGKLAVCDAWCPLLNSSTLSDYSDTEEMTTVAFGDTTLTWTPTYQEFGFVNSIYVDTLVFEALSSFGSSVALSSLQIYQSQFSTYANNTLNEPSCGGNYSRAEVTGSWEASSDGKYLVSNVDTDANLSDIGVTFYPNITYAGEYSILIYTPGCLSDDSCDSRGIVNASVSYVDSGEIVESTLIYQTNDEEKYDSLFYGHLEGAVKVDMVLYAPGSSPDSVTVVADRISTTIFSIDDIVNKNGTVPINGIFEYSPSNFTRFDAAHLSNSSFIGNSTINKLGGSLSQNANVTLAYQNGSLFVGGDFQSTYGDNLFQVDIDESSLTSSEVNASVESIDGGLNGPVYSVRSVGNGVIILGDFDGLNGETTIRSLDGSSSSLQNVCYYNGSWYGFDETLSSSFTNITLGDNEYWVFGASKWNENTKSWLSGSTLLSFNVTSAAKNDGTLFLGSLRTSEYVSNNGILVNNSSNLTNITSEFLQLGTITTGLYINDSLSVFGGSFNTSESISNIFFVGDEKSTGLDIDWSLNSSVTKLFTARDSLFIGSGSGGEASGEAFQGVLIYDLNNGTFSPLQPGFLSLEGSTPKIHEFGYLNNTYLVVGGEFDSAGSSADSGLAFYNLNDSSWESLIDSFTGSVFTFRFLNTTIIAGGNISYNGEDLKLFSYDFGSGNDTQPKHFSDIEYTVKSLLLVDNSTAGRIIVSGDDFISAYDGASWISIDHGLSGLTITDIALLNLDSSNSLNNESYFDSDQILVASGSFNITGYGYANVAFFNSTHWIPYLISTKGTGTSIIESIYLNKDISSWYTSGSISNSTTTPSESSSTPTPTHSNTSKTLKSGKMDRGFIVLVGLASAVGTMGVLGAAGALLMFKRKNNDYSPIKPRVNETEMLDTVPPENLLKHI